MILNRLIRCARYPWPFVILTTGLLFLSSVRPSAAQSSGQDAWFDFVPSSKALQGNSEFDLRFLNEAYAGEHGFIAVKDGQFVHAMDSKPVRFWAVNGPPQDLQGDELKRCARLLARYGVNLVRVHTPMFNQDGEVDMAKVNHAHEIVTAMKAEGIYTHFSIYFPVWFKPSAKLDWLPGYDGQKHPFAALMFNEAFQAKHRSWLKALFTTVHPATGKSLLDEPAVFGVELQNEDSFFFWTFDEKNIPDPQMRIIEKQFGDWLIRKYGSLQESFKRWGSPKLGRDALGEGRIAVRPLWNIAHEKTVRDQDTAAFLLEKQTEFYESSTKYLRSIGFKGLVHASNWATASPEVFGPLEKWSYTTGDFIDRHGYFECHHQGDNAAWSIRPSHTYRDRSALHFEADAPNKPKEFVHPVMDPHYNNKPSMISETTFTRPNRFRSEAPLYFACYGALQSSDCIVHFALDGDRWNVKPGFWMQQWTIATPAMLGQFPAAAMIYRQGLVQPGKVVADIQLNKKDLVELKGTPLPQDASFDELRLQDIPKDAKSIQPGQRLDPLLHYVGQSRVSFTDNPTQIKVEAFDTYIDRKAQTVTSSHGELKLNYEQGLLLINTPQAQGASGNLAAAQSIKLADLTISCDLDLAHVIAVALDAKPLAISNRILLQVMTEERATGFATQAGEKDVKRIQDIGRDPWQVRQIQGRVQFNRLDSSMLKVTALDVDGLRTAETSQGGSVRLSPNRVYYLIER